MRIPEPIPLGETFLEARVRAMMVALLVNSRARGKVETVFTFAPVMDAHFRSFAQMVLPELIKQGIGPLGMKPLGGGEGIILKSKTVTALECLRDALSLPTSAVITGIDKQEALDQAFAVAKTFKALDREQISQLLAKTAEVAKNGQYELFKTTSHFDTMAKHPDWLGGDTPEVQKMAPPGVA